MLESGVPGLSTRCQCRLLSIHRSGVYYRPKENPEREADDSALRDRIWEIFSAHPVYGYRRVWAMLDRSGCTITPKRVRAIMRDMGLRAIYPRRRLSIGNAQHKKYPYFLKGVDITRPNQVWSTDITYIRLPKGFCYLTAIMDWYSRRVISWELSMTLDADFCVSALDRALSTGTPEIFNSDQGCQYTSEAFAGRLLAKGVSISMDGKGRAFDNILTERLWRTVKYEEVLLKEYGSMAEARMELGRFFEWYNGERPHQSLGYQTPDEVYYGRVLLPTG
jgi:putative transposase